MIPVFSIVSGQSNMGKTTLMCKIIKELKTRGYKIATVKHHWGDFEIDQPGKDSWKHRRAGADTVIISSPTKIASIREVEERTKLDDIIGKIRDVDIIITEGYGFENKPKLEVIRKELSEKLDSKEEELFAIVADFQLDTKIPLFTFQQLGEIVDLIEDKFL